MKYASNNAMNSAMSYTQRQLLYVAITVLLIGGGTWWWLENMKREWQAIPEISSEATKNPMLAATRLLTQHKHKVTSEDALSDALLKPIPKGTLILPANDSLMTNEQAKKLIAWANQGNTLIIRPKWSSRTRYAECDERIGNVEEDEKKEEKTTEEKADKKDVRSATPSDTAAADPIGAYLHVDLVNLKKPDEKKSDDEEEDDEAQDAIKDKKTETNAKEDSSPTDAENSGGAAGKSDASDTSGVAITPKNKNKTKSFKRSKISNPDICFSQITIPGKAYSLQLDADKANLISTLSSKPMVLSDNAEVAVRVFAEGKGHIILLANNYFSNANLNEYDHGELLLDLVKLNTSSSDIIIVQRVDAPSWYKTLWAYYHLGITSLGCALLLLFWVAVRRFGPMLPEPDQERRAIIEHIDASGRWLWKIPGGREILLASARAATNKLLQRRAPELGRLEPAAQVHRMARQCNLKEADVVSALHKPAGKLAYEFTLQIQILQQLRKLYERQRNNS